MEKSCATCTFRDSEGYCRYSPPDAANDAVLLNSAWQKASNNDLCIQWEPRSEPDRAAEDTAQLC